MTINIADVNPGDELTVRFGIPGDPEQWVTVTDKVRRGWDEILLLGDLIVRYSNGNLGGYIREIVSHTPAKPTEPQNIGAAVEDTDGQVWVRFRWGLGMLAWRNTKPSGSGVRNYWRYEDINVVKVLHEGWPA